jgi:hypothetical protein
MTEQGDIEGRVTGCVGGKWGRLRRCHLPARLCRTRHRLRIHPQHQCQYPRRCRCHRQSARRRQVEQGGLSPGFDHERADLSAFGDVRPRTQRCECIGRIDQNKVAGIKTEFPKPVNMKPSAMMVVFPLADPEYRKSGNIGAHRNHGCESSGHAAVLRRCRKNLVQCPTQQTSTQMAIKRIDAECDPVIGHGNACIGLSA